MLASGAVDQQVACEEGKGAGSQPDSDCPIAVGGRVRFVNELERDRADQHARAKRHDSTEHLARHVPEICDQRANQERCAADKTPKERCAHSESLHLAPADLPLCGIFTTTPELVAESSAIRPSLGSTRSPLGNATHAPHRQLPQYPSLSAPVF